METARTIRILVLLGGAFVCVGINIWLVATGHFRLPVLVLLLYVSIVALTVRRTSPSPTRDEAQRSLKASRSARRLAFLGLVMFAVSVFTYSRNDFKGIPAWGIVLLYVWGAVVVCCYLWSARWFRRNPQALNSASKDVKE